MNPGKSLQCLILQYCFELGFDSMCSNKEHFRSVFFPVLAMYFAWIFYLSNR